MKLLKIGRDGSCDIVLHSDKASSLHAEIVILDNGDILLEDKNSRNGTFIMNHPIKPAAQVNIKRGDAVRFADVELLWDQIPMPEDNTRFKAVYGIGTNFRNDIQIVGNTVSRFHATLKIDKKNIAYIYDHSKNGTEINGKRITPDKAYKIKKSDVITCGGIPVDLSSYMHNSFMPLLLKVAASLVLIVGIGYGAYKTYSVISGEEITPSSIKAMENASVCVYGGYYIEVTLKDNPMIGESFGSSWPKKWFFGVDNNGNYVCSTNKSEVNPIEYTGTAFFISENGELGTNRHVALPWSHRSRALDDFIKDKMRVMRSESNETVAYLLNYLYASGHLNLSTARAKYERFYNSDIEISGSHTYFGIGLFGSKVNSVMDLQQAQVIADSGDPKKDVALIRLNSRKTPDHIMKMGAVYNLEQARVDEQTLQPQEDLVIVGYPLGDTVNKEMFNDKELRPTIHKTTLSKTADDNQFQIQTNGIGGQSGSPVSDKDHRLVGILYGGFDGTEVTFCCNIKHLVELYNKHKVRE